MTNQSIQRAGSVDGSRGERAQGEPKCALLSCFTHLPGRTTTALKISGEAVNILLVKIAYKIYYRFFFFNFGAIVENEFGQF